MFDIDFLALVKIIGLDIVLGGDNAIVIALAVMGLAPALQKKGIFWGTAGAVGLRALLLVLAGWLLTVPYLGDGLKLFGGAYLAWLAVTMGNDEEEHNIDQADSLWGAVKTIIIADFAMSLDNVLAVISASQSAGEHSTLYAVGGIVISIPIIVWGATYVIKAMEKWPVLVDVGAALLAYVGVEMIFHADIAKSVVEYAGYASYAAAGGVFAYRRVK